MDKNRIGEKLKPYVQAVPDIFIYQIITKIALAILLFLLRGIFHALLKSSGRVAVTTGDWKFLFTTWQGVCILLLGVVSLFIYIAFDLNSKIVLSRDLLTGRQASVIDRMKEGFSSIRNLICLRGMLVIIYIALIAPVLGIGLSITATEGLYIPTFISSVIEDSVLFSALALVAVIFFAAVGIGNLFILHGVVIDGLAVADAGVQSRQLVKANWKDYLKQNVLFILTIGLSLTLVAVLCLFMPLKLISMLPAGAITRLLTIFLVAAGTVISAMTDLLAVPVYLFKMTRLYYTYKQGKDCGFREIKRKKRISTRKGVIVTLAAVIAVVLIIFAFFDQLFPPGTDVRIIAHRGGGNEGSENTLSGLETAWNAGAYGSEIDIQRTKDGYYVLNHDSTFKRVAGDDRQPSEMTLREVKELDVDGEPVPTFEEMLIAGKGRMVLFAELKGSTADKQMADDAVAMIKQYRMEDEAVLISLKYDLIDYIETSYPEIQTGFLTFASFGKTAKLNCDYIGLEEESATADAISSVHEEGKKVLVWTCNEKGSQKHFLCTNADGLITDNVSQAIEVASQLDRRSDVDRMVDRIKTIF